jgi:hypothetical protein
MPSLSDTYYKIRDGSLTASHCVDIFADSTVTEGIAHPPHPHAHMSTDGMVIRDTGDLKAARERVIWLRMKINTKYKTKPPEFDSWNREFTKLQQNILKWESDKAEKNLEGLHLDTVTKQKHIPAKYQLQTDYTVRNAHSQFEDSESAIMALFYVLRSEAGKMALYEIMNGWFFSASWTRVSIQSVTGVKGLQAGPIAPKVKEGETASSHPLRGRPIGMVERGQGSAGQAPRPQVAMARITTVLDRVGSNQVRLVTHFPRSGWNAPNNIHFNGNSGNFDFVEFVNFNAHPSKKEWKWYASTTPATLVW